MDLMQPPIPSDEPKAPPPPPTSADQPPRKPVGALKKVAAVLVAGVSVLYLINPTLGLFELLPDALPVVGNLDEAFFTLALVSALGALGLEIPFLRRR